MFFKSKLKPVTEGEFLSKAVPYIEQYESEHSLRVMSLEDSSIELSSSFRDNPHYDKVKGLLEGDKLILAEDVQSARFILSETLYRKDVSGFNRAHPHRQLRAYWWEAYRDFEYLPEFKTALEESVARFRVRVAPVELKLHQRVSSTVNQKRIIEHYHPGRSKEFINGQWVLMKLRPSDISAVDGIHAWSTGVDGFFAMPRVLFSGEFCLFENLSGFHQLRLIDQHGFAVVERQPTFDEVKAIDSVFSSDGVSLTDALDILNEV